MSTWQNNLVWTLLSSAYLALLAMQIGKLLPNPSWIVDANEHLDDDSFVRGFDRNRHDLPRIATLDYRAHVDLVDAKNLPKLPKLQLHTLCTLPLADTVVCVMPMMTCPALTIVRTGAMPVVGRKQHRRLRR